VQEPRSEAENSNGDNSKLADSPSYPLRN
jgi:hypothetical protein